MTYQEQLDQMILMNFAQLSLIRLLFSDFNDFELPSKIINGIKIFYSRNGQASQTMFLILAHLVELKVQLKNSLLDGARKKIFSKQQL